MSNYLAIATVTATLGQLLHKAANEAVPGAGTSAGRPKSADNGQADAEINIYLYQVTPNTALRNADLPTRRPDGTLLQRPQAALTLHYLLTFYGKEVQMEPQRLLGSTVSALHAQPVLTQDMIRATVNTAVAADPNHFLAGSDLADQVETIKFAPLLLNLEELSKLWSVFFQTPYALSVAYQASVVLIEASGTPQEALPIRAPQVYGTTFRRPAIREILAQAGAGHPIVLGSTLVIRGKQLQGQITKVRIGDVEATPTSASDTQISLPLIAPFDALQAGVQAAQVVHLTLIGTPPTLHRGVESNVAAFVLSPTIVKDGGGNAKIALSNLQVAANGTRSAQVTVELSPKVGKSQRAALLLNEASPPSDRSARAYVFDAEPRTLDAAAVDFSISGVEAGEYLVRVQVDRAESPLDVDTNGRYSDPTVEIT
jgi:hypothetical protein